MVSDKMSKTYVSMSYLSLSAVREAFTFPVHVHLVHQFQNLDTGLGRSTMERVVQVNQKPADIVWRAVVKYGTVGKALSQGGLHLSVEWVTVSCKIDCT